MCTVTVPPVIPAPITMLSMKGVDVQGVEDRLKKKLVSGSATEDDKEFLKLYLRAKLAGKQNE